jgi:hypothetical protein
VGVRGEDRGGDGLDGKRTSEALAAARGQLNRNFLPSSAFGDRGSQMGGSDVGPSY